MGRHDSVLCKNMQTYVFLLLLLLLLLLLIIIIIIIIIIIVIIIIVVVFIIYEIGKPNGQPITLFERISQDIKCVILFSNGMSVLYYTLVLWIFTVYMAALILFYFQNKH